LRGEQFTICVGWAALAVCSIKPAPSQWRRWHLRSLMAFSSQLIRRHAQDCSKDLKVDSNPGFGATAQDSHPW